MSYFNSPRMRTDNLVFHVDPANIKSYVGTGNYWYDTSSTKATGVITNITTSISYSSTNKGIFNFTGGGYVDFAQPTLSLTRYNQISILMFCKINTYSGDDTQKAMGIDNFFNFQPNHRTVDSSSRMELYLGGAWRSVAYGGSLTFNDWNLFAGTYDGSNLKLYKNGVNIATTAFASGTFNSSYGTPTLRVGDMGNQSKYFNGSIGVTSIYNKAMTDAEIIQYYNTFKGRYGL